MLDNFEKVKTFPSHFRWPENRSYIPPGSRDLDGDGKNDFIRIMEDEGIFQVISGNTHEVLYNSVLFEDILLSGYLSAAFIDFCGTGQKQILLCGSNTGPELRDMESSCSLIPLRVKYIGLTNHTWIMAIVCVLSSLPWKTQWSVS